MSNVESEAFRRGAEAMRRRCGRACLADLLGVPGGIVPASQRFDGGSSARAAERIAAAIEALPVPEDES